MIFTLNCFIAKSLPNYLAGKMEPPGIFEWLLGVAACQKFARLWRLVLKNLAYAVLSLCNVLGSINPGRFLHTYQNRCGAFGVREDALFHLQFWSWGKVANFWCSQESPCFLPSVFSYEVFVERQRLCIAAFHFCGVIILLEMRRLLC